MADLSTLQNAFMKAHTAGDTASAQVLATEIKRQMAAPAQAAPAQQASGIDPSLPPMLSPEAKQAMGNQYGMGNQIANAMTMGMGDKISAGLMGGIQGGIVDPIMGRGFNVGSRYNEDLANQRDAAAQYAQQHPVAAPAGTIAGALLGLKFMPTIGSGASGVVKTGAAYGAGLGATSDANSLDERAQNTISGGIGGAVTAPLIAAGIHYVPAIGRGIAAPLMGYLNPEGMANSILERAVQKTGQTVPDIQNIIAQANAEGNKGFTTADALGAKGQNLLSTIARSPNDMQQAVAETMLNRQAGQSGRVGGFLKDALGANQTADQLSSGLTKIRGNVADTNYTMARGNAVPVDLTEPINTIDKLLGPNAKFNIGIAPDSTEAALMNLRDSLASGTGPQGITSRSDFDKILSMKGDLKDTIDSLYAAGKSNKANALKAVYKQLDGALSNASVDYRNANDTFARMSRPIEAIDLGAQAARPSNRAADTVQTFQGLDRPSQDAFRLGYADPLLGRIETGAPGVNAVRPFLSDKFQQEFGTLANNPALLGRQLQNEATMNATMQRALGGSKTADNLLNEAQMSAVDPSTLLNIAKHPISGTLGWAIGKGSDLLTGNSAAVRALLGQRLLSQDPASFVGALNNSRNMSAAKRAALIKLITPASGMLGGYASKSLTQ